MICREIIDTIEKRYPKECAMEWDNVGLLAGRYEKEVGKIYIALDATDEVDAAGRSVNAARFAVEVLDET